MAEVVTRGADRRWLVVFVVEGTRAGSSRSLMCPLRLKESAPSINNFCTDRHKKAHEPFTRPTVAISPSDAEQD